MMVLAAVVVWAQLVAAPHILRGTVRSTDTDQPLAFSIVTLTPTLRRHFTDSAGTFAFPNINPGMYLVSVRQIGYAPLDTPVIVPPAREVTLALTLRRLAIELPPVTITARPRCTHPGAPDARHDPALAAAFDQLQENARRFALLADSYPFDYWLEQRLQEVTARGDTLRGTLDTIRLDSRSEPRYAVGRVVTPGRWPWHSDLLVRTPSLEEFSNPAFVTHHCFYLAGRDTIDGETLVRIDFEPDVKLGRADMAGSAYLDSASYQLRFTESSLTHPERTNLADVATMTTRTRFRDIGAGAGIPLQDHLRAVTTFRLGGARRRIETQRTIEVRFRRQSPLRARP